MHSSFEYNCTLLSFAFLQLGCFCINVFFVGSSPSCELYYNTSDAICFTYGSIGRDYVFFNNSIDTKEQLNSKLIRLHKTLQNNVISGAYPMECVDLILGLMCHNSFPLCDYSSDTPVPRKVCNTLSCIQ